MPSPLIFFQFLVVFDPHVRQIQLFFRVFRPEAEWISCVARRTENLKSTCFFFFVSFVKAVTFAVFFGLRHVQFFPPCLFFFLQLFNSSHCVRAHLNSFFFPPPPSVNFPLQSAVEFLCVVSVRSEVPHPYAPWTLILVQIFLASYPAACPPVLCAPFCLQLR